MQAIVTKYLPTTSTKPSRVKATCDAGSIIVSWDHAADISTNHEIAAARLAEKLKWGGTWAEGSVGGGYVYVCVDRADTFYVRGAK